MDHLLKRYSDVNYVIEIETFTDTYSRVQKSIENWSVWCKMALEEVGVSLP